LCKQHSSQAPSPPLPQSLPPSFPCHSPPLPQSLPPSGVAGVTVRWGWRGGGWAVVVVVAVVAVVVVVTVVAVMAVAVVAGVAV
jgi:hypothetical protein